MRGRGLSRRFLRSVRVGDRWLVPVDALEALTSGDRFHLFLVLAFDYDLARIVSDNNVAGDELRAIRRWLATRRDHLPWLFLSERANRSPANR